MSTAGPPGTDRRLLQEEAYADGGNLRARSGIYRWLVEPAGDFHDTVLGAATWTPGARVLDIGCGPGAYLARLVAREPGLRVVGADLSHGMAVEARAAAPQAAVLVADVQQTPFADATFDRVLAPHMLYHAPDPDRAVADIRRVLRPGGVALVVTNGGDHLDGFTRLLAAHAGVDDWLRTFRLFDLDGGEAILLRHFDSVTRRDLVGELAVPDADAVVAYVASTRYSLEPQLPPDLAWADTLASIRSAVEDEIRTTGAFRSQTHTGILTCH